MDLYSPCVDCQKDQEELFERTGGSCGQIICNCHNFEQNQAEQQLTDEDTIRFLQENDSTLSQLLDASDSVMTDTSKGC